MIEAIRLYPDEDVPRLQYADWLDEQDMCPDPGRAELIHVQCELAHYLSASDTLLSRHMTPTSKWIELRVRESTLFTEHGERWRIGSQCVECGGVGQFVYPSVGAINTCQWCWGSGDAGGLMRMFRQLREGDEPNVRYVPIGVEYNRGFISRVIVPRLADVVEGGDVSDFTEDGEIVTQEYDPTPWLRAVLTETPERRLIREIVPLDKFPIILPGSPSPNKGQWFNGGTTSINSLPDVLFDKLSGILVQSNGASFKEYLTQQEAEVDFYRVLANFGRSNL